MGLDVNLYAEGEVSDAELEAANALLLNRSQIASWGDPGDRALVRSEHVEDRVEFQTLCRYYGPSYERGSWPDIYGAIRLMRAALPGCRVLYGSDEDDDNGDECTDEFLAEMWEHFLGLHGDDYRSVK